MKKSLIQNNGVSIAILQSDEVIISDAQSALDLIATIDYHDKCQRIAVHKEAVTADFFNLSTGIAGEILQKVVNYSKKIAIIGDFSMYTSKAFNDFIYECNNGNTVFFVPDEAAAIEKLSAVR